jgi:hypothetical protein
MTEEDRTLIEIWLSLFLDGEELDAAIDALPEPLSDAE